MLESGKLYGPFTDAWFYFLGGPKFKISIKFFVPFCCTEQFSKIQEVYSYFFKFALELTNYNFANLFPSQDRIRFGLRVMRKIQAFF